MSERKCLKRARERLELNLPVRVHCRETPDFDWTENTQLIDVTPFGGKFRLRHPTERGRLLHLRIPMPAQLRVFDPLEDQYRVWALVRYVRVVEAPVPEKIALFEVGVAFIGKNPPRSYEEEPSRRYEAASIDESMALAEGTEEIAPVSSSDQRVYTRHNIPVDVLIEVLGEDGETTETETTVTENISTKGATIFTSLDMPPGRFVKLTSQEFALTIYAAIRARRTGADGIPRIHVEFIDKDWPL